MLSFPLSFEALHKKKREIHLTTKSAFVTTTIMQIKCNFKSNNRKYIVWESLFFVVFFTI